MGTRDRAAIVISVCLPSVLTLGCLTFELEFEDLLVSAHEERILFVAPDGDDANPGTPDAPFATLEAARDAIRARRLTRPDASGFTVLVDEGVYFRTETFRLTEADSGQPYAPMIYRAWPGGEVRLIGGVKLEPGWCTPVTDPAILARLPEIARGRVVQANLKAQGIEDYGEMSISGPMLELFCNGKRLPLARYPNDGWMYIDQIVESDDAGRPRLADENKQGQAFQYTDGRPARWLDAEELELHGFWYFGWTDEHCKVDEIDPDNQLITLDHVPGGGMRKGQWFRALNLLEEIDLPGEWYLDRTRGVLYLWPPWSKHDIFLSTLDEPLLALDGAEHVTFRDMTFEVTRGVGVVLGGGTHQLLAGCTIRAIGATAIVMDHGTYNGVLGCDIHDAGMTGLRLSGGNRYTLQPSGNYIVNNHIHHYAQRKKVYQPAVRLYGCGHRVAHNLIHDAPHQAIGYDGNDHLIELNEIHHVVLESADAGVLYTGRNWTWRGNVVRHNFIHHIPHGPGLGTVGIYLDDCCSSTDMIGNVFYDMLKPTFVGGGRDNTIANNLFIECDVPVYLDNRGLRWDHFRPRGPMYEDLERVRHTEPPYSERYPALARILDEIPQAPLGNVCINNVSYKSTWRDPEQFCRETSGNHIDRPYMRLENNYITDDDPGFVDPANMDFALEDDSVVYEKIPDFQPIPFHNIGLYDDSYRASWPPDDPHRGDRPDR